MQFLAQAALVALQALTEDRLHRHDMDPDNVQVARFQARPAIQISFSASYSTKAKTPSRCPQICAAASGLLPSFCYSGMMTSQSEPVEK